MTLQLFNTLTPQHQEEELFKCCGCTKWVEQLSKKVPISSVEELKIESDKIWFALDKEDLLEAFSHHPKIGDKSSLQKKFATKEWATNEQSGVNNASELLIDELAKGNVDYEKKFGYIFIVCATGKSAGELLEMLKKRFPNPPEVEIKIASREQNKITHLRINKLFS